jgi:hypothetical protein
MPTDFGHKRSRKERNMNKLIILLIAVMTPACTIHVHEHGYVEYGETVRYQPVRRVVVPAPTVYHQYSWRARGCINLNPNVCRRRGQ